MFSKEEINLMRSLGLDCDLTVYLRPMNIGQT